LNVVRFICSENLKLLRPLLNIIQDVTLNVKPCVNSSIRSLSAALVLFSMRMLLSGEARVGFDNVLSIIIDNNRYRQANQ
jgi:hypothetical protein